MLSCPSLSLSVPLSCTHSSALDPCCSTVPARNPTLQFQSVPRPRPQPCPPVRLPPCSSPHRALHERRNAPDALAALQLPRSLPFAAPLEREPPLCELVARGRPRAGGRRRRRGCGGEVVCKFGGAEERALCVSGAREREVACSGARARLRQSARAGGGDAETRGGGTHRLRWRAARRGALDAAHLWPEH